MQITEEEMKIYRRSACERLQRRQEDLAARRQRARETARQAAEVLKKDFGASRVVLFGALLHLQLFHACSDVEHCFRAVARLLNLDPEIEINLVPIEDVRPELRPVIEREGVELSW
jgi:predicted nucleotidyltransferase